MLATDRALNFLHVLIQIDRHIPHLAHALRTGQVQERTNVQLAMCGVCEKRGRDLMGLQHVLHLHEEIGQRGGRHGDVFHKRQRTTWIP